jgi:hypothetical protein
MSVAESRSGKPAGQENFSTPCRESGAGTDGMPPSLIQEESAVVFLFGWADQESSPAL